MFGSTVLEVAIGVVFVYLVLSLLCTAINEAIATLLNKRGKNLFEGIKNLLNDPNSPGWRSNCIITAWWMAFRRTQRSAKSLTACPPICHPVSSRCPHGYTAGQGQPARKRSREQRLLPNASRQPPRAIRSTAHHHAVFRLLTNLEKRFYLRHGWIPSGTTMDLNLQKALDQSRERRQPQYRSRQSADAVTTAVRASPRRAYERSAVRR